MGDTGTPAGMIGQMGGALADDLKKGRFELPTSLPGKAAVEEFSASEGGGLGAAGSGTGAPLPTFSDVEKLIRADLKDLTINPDGLIIRLSNEVLFDFDSDQLRSNALPLLQKVAAIMSRYPGANVSIEGHTDTFGTDDYNMKLSERRAETVGSWVQKNLKAEMGSFAMKGFGKMRPIVNPRGSVSEQQANRRVEIHIKARKH